MNLADQVRFHVYIMTEIRVLLSLCRLMETSHGRTDFLQYISDLLDVE